jgi:hypothetical protein
VEVKCLRILAALKAIEFSDCSVGALQVLADKDYLFFATTGAYVLFLVT